MALATAAYAAQDWVAQDSFSAETGSSFGASVALFGEFIAIGAPSGANGGSVFLYDSYNAENGTEVKKLTLVYSFLFAQIRLNCRSQPQMPRNMMSLDMLFQSPIPCWL